MTDDELYTEIEKRVLIRLAGFEGSVKRAIRKAIRSAKAAAVAAERERCAKIVEAAETGWGDDPPDLGAVVARIRKGAE